MAKQLITLTVNGDDYEVAVTPQQTLLDADPSFQMRALGADQGFTHVRLLLKKRIEEEMAARAPSEGMMQTAF